MRNKFKLNTKTYDGWVEYTCVSCGYRNKHYWFGAEEHWCNQCDHKTLIRGEMVAAPKAIGIKIK